MLSENNRILGIGIDLANLCCAWRMRTGRIAYIIISAFAKLGKFQYCFTIEFEFQYCCTFEFEEDAKVDILVNLIAHGCTTGGYGLHVDYE